jgi:UDP-glucose 4-epimerase
MYTAKESGVDRVVYACSSSAYGDTPTLPKVETMPPSPLSPYAIQKYTGEMYGRVFNSIFGLKTLGLRYFNVFGPRQNPDSEYSAVIPKFIKLMKRGETPTIYGDGETTRDFTYIDNVVEANILALSADKGFGEIMNVAAASRISLNELVNKINIAIGTDIEAEHADKRPGDIKDSYADISKAQELLGYGVLKDFEEGLKLTADSIK